MKPALWVEKLSAAFPDWTITETQSTGETATHRWFARRGNLVLKATLPQSLRDKVEWYERNEIDRLLAGGGR